jgi:hypothetical protein
VLWYGTVATSMHISDYLRYLAVYPTLVPNSDLVTPETYTFRDTKRLTLRDAMKNPDSLMFYVLCKYMLQSPSSTHQLTWSCLQRS